ncbi:MAG TPA: hypothetical protein PKA41_02085 [Verrucomicrobiota bacterium]|nr:hypothetical protein [Verrucomicrobiota bacterium]
MSGNNETLRFDDLKPYLLLKNGNYLYKVPFRGGWAVLKVYYGSRGWFSCVVKSLENVLLAGQTSYMPKTRLRMEAECMAIWAKHGFRVFKTYPEVRVEAPDCPPGGYMLFECVEAPKLGDILRDESVPAEERWKIFRRWVPEWSRRHDIAIREQEPRLAHENGDSKHVMILDKEFLWFDFEMTFRNRAKTADHISHEIIQYIWNLCKNTPPGISDRIIAEIVLHYPDKQRLLRAHDYFWRHPNLIHRWGRALDRKLKAKNQKANSKYSIARLLREEVLRSKS